MYIKYKLHEDYFISIFKGIFFFPVEIPDLEVCTIKPKGFMNKERGIIFTPYILLISLLIQLTLPI